MSDKNKIKEQDAAAGLTRVTVAGVDFGGYDPSVALRILELVASGKTMTEITAMPDMPSQTTVYKWMGLYPDFGKLVKKARTFSSYPIEESALRLARYLEDNTNLTAPRVAAIRAAMEQYRWSAARRNPAEYGQTQGQGSTVIPIQINTTLDFDGHMEKKADVYTVVARPLPPEDEPSPEPLTVAPDYMDLTPPAEVENPKLGTPATRKPRLRKGHKSASMTQRTITQRANRAAKEAGSK